jgi:hypothetical protein
VVAVTRPVSRRPTRLAAGASLAAGVLALAASAPYSWTGLALGTGGLLVLSVGVVRGADAAITLGAAGLLAAALAAGARAAPVLPTLAAVTGSVVAWDAGRHAASVGRQLGRDADTRRVELVHVTASVGVGVVAAGLGYTVYATAAGDQPVAALAFSLLAAVLLVEALG